MEIFSRNHIVSTECLVNNTCNYVNASIYATYTRLIAESLLILKA